MTPRSALVATVLLLVGCGDRDADLAGQSEKLISGTVPPNGQVVAAGTFALRLSRRRR